MIFNRFKRLCVVIDVLADAWVEEVMKVSVKVFVINVRADVVIDKFSGVQVVSDIAAEVLTDVNANVLVVAMTALQFPMPAPWEEPMSFC